VFTIIGDYLAHKTTYFFKINLTQPHKVTLCGYVRLLDYLNTSKVKLCVTQSLTLLVFKQSSNP